MNSIPHHFDLEVERIVQQFDTLDQEDLNQKQSSEEISCEKCDYVCKSKHSLRKHMQSVHEGLSCDQCNFNALTKIDLKLHVETSHKIDDNIRKEDLEVKQTIKRKYEHDNLPTRKKSKNDSVSKNIEISCEECDFKTHGKRSLNNHTKKVHNNMN